MRGRPSSIAGRRVRRIGHLVVAVKRGHVPRDVGRDAGDELGQPRELVVASR